MLLEALSQIEIGELDFTLSLRLCFVNKDRSMVSLAAVASCKFGGQKWQEGFARMPCALCLYLFQIWLGMTSLRASREFHSLLPKLLKREGLYSYFNGLAADNAFFHAVYCEICKRELAALGLDTQFVALPIQCVDLGVFENVKNKYWQLESYFLPVAEWSSECRA